MYLIHKRMSAAGFPSLYSKAHTRKSRDCCAGVVSEMNTHPGIYVIILFAYCNYYYTVEGVQTWLSACPAAEDGRRAALAVTGSGTLPPDCLLKSPPNSFYSV